MKLEAVRCVGVWCVTADTMPAEATKQFERGLAEKDALLQAHLRALVQVRLAAFCDSHHVQYLSLCE